jgi:hypothetical protein
MLNALGFVACRAETTWGSNCFARYRTDLAGGVRTMIIIDKARNPPNVCAGAKSLVIARIFPPKTLRADEIEAVQMGKLIMSSDAFVIEGQSR